MNRPHLALAAALAATLAACASSQPRPPSGLAKVDANGNRVICQMERPIGSNIAEMVCRTQESHDADRQAAQHAMDTGPKTGLSGSNN